MLFRQQQRIRGGCIYADGVDVYCFDNGKRSRQRTQTPTSTALSKEPIMTATKTLIAAALIAVSAVGSSAFAQSYSHLDPITASQKSRAEVLADLEIYRESGLAAADRTEDFALNVGQRAKAEARYAELKASPKYAALVQKFAAKEGKGAVTEGVAAR
ncbi:DUF4148 domain-containing protein [Mitsuaria sp. GD03876]|uniref:DUF4148 domain-containing protein n=1 Tax=Mitsuaria sp. GD03876 TaxID=2975399 RepID=UPI00244695AF|nr:DUF4148 domain-containing protein [Mitsuaria sp. GD03876]MDH0865099.1 hypothetical protein [Mitsuaria sp. GD03876]